MFLFEPKGNEGVALARGGFIVMIRRLAGFERLKRTNLHMGVVVVLLPDDLLQSHLFGLCHTLRTLNI